MDFIPMAERVAGNYFGINMAIKRKNKEIYYTASYNENKNKTAFKLTILQSPKLTQLQKVLITEIYQINAQKWWSTPYF